MRTVDFSTLMFRYMQIAGLDRNAITTANFQQFRDFANARLRQIWDSEYWPDLMRTSDAPGETVTTDSNGVRTVAVPTDAGEVTNLFDRDPRLTTQARIVKYYLYQDGTDLMANIMQSVSPVFFEYRLKAPELFGDPYSSTATYSVGAQIYFDTSLNSGGFTPTGTTLPSGNIYKCLVATSAAQTPVSTPSAWQKIEIPFFAGDYVVRACVSDYLRSEGQFEQAAVVENEAEALRMLEVDRVLRQEGQIKTLNVFTY